MVIIRFPDPEMRRRGVAYLLGRFSGKSWVTGEIMTPEQALPHLAAEGIPFSVEGPAAYDRVLKLNDMATSAVAQKQPAKAA